jgi:hypothetical protein
MTHGRIKGLGGIPLRVDSERALYLNGVYYRRWPDGGWPANVQAHRSDGFCDLGCFSVPIHTTAGL